MSSATPAGAGSDQLPRGPRATARLAAALYQAEHGPARWRQSARPWICPFDALLPEVPVGSRVLDVGCGGGLLLGLLQRTGRLAAGEGFDVSGSAIEVAQAMARRLGAGASLVFHRRDVEAPWPDGPYDVVALVDVMHHVPPSARRTVLDHAAARVAPGGRLLYKDMCRRPRWRALANRMHDVVMAREWIREEPIEHVEAWARDHGLDLVTSRRIDRLWYGHELRVFTRAE